MLVISKKSNENPKEKDLKDKETRKNITKSRKSSFQKKRTRNKNMRKVKIFSLEPRITKTVRRRKCGKSKSSYMHQESQKQLDRESVVSQNILTCTKNHKNLA